MRPLGLIGVEEKRTMIPPRSGGAPSGIQSPAPGVAGRGAVNLDPPSSTWLLGEPGLAGRVALSWALAGGLTMEAVLVLAAILSGTRAATSDPLAATFFFVVGVVGGFVHGALVGVVGRPDHVPLARAVRSVERSAVVTVPFAVLTWGAALWITLTSTGVARGRLDLLLSIAAGWVILAGAVVWALREGRCALRHTVTRWPLGRREGFLLGAVSASLMVSFIWWRPEIWFTDVRTTWLGAAILALGVTVWFALPVLVLGVHLVRRRSDVSSPAQDGETGDREGPV